MTGGDELDLAECFYRGVNSAYRQPPSVCSVAPVLSSEAFSDLLRGHWDDWELGWPKERARIDRLESEWRQELARRVLNECMIVRIL